MTTTRKRRGRPPKYDTSPYEIAKATTGKYVVYLHGSVRYAADTEDECREYIDKLKGAQ